MRTERKTGTSELFPLKGKKIWGKRKGWRNPYTIVLHYWMRDRTEGERGLREREKQEGLSMEAACSGPGVRLDTLGS